MKDRHKWSREKLESAQNCEIKWLLDLNECVSVWVYACACWCVFFSANTFY